MRQNNLSLLGLDRPILWQRWAAKKTIERRLEDAATVELETQIDATNLKMPRYAKGLLKLKRLFFQALVVINRLHISEIWPQNCHRKGNGVTSPNFDV